MDAFARRAVRAAAPRNFLVVAAIGLTAMTAATPTWGQGTGTWIPVPPLETNETLGEAWVKRTEEAFMQRAPGLAPDQAERDRPREEAQSVWNSLAATWLFIVVAGLLLLGAGAVHRWLHADQGDGPSSILK